MRAAGTYLVTGAFGALGSALCNDLAGPGRKFVLVGSNGARTRGAARLSDLAGDSRVRRLVAELEKAGSEVVVEYADVAVRDDVQRVLVAARARFGAIDAVYHLAGVLDDGLAITKTAAGMRRVLGAKALGALLLAELTSAESNPPQLVLFASTSGLLGPAGQVDYAAANAVLDGIAAAHPDRVLAVDWGIWRQIGMAAQSATHADSLLEDELAFTDWPLFEHRVAPDTAVVPGTMHLELLARAISDGGEVQDVSLEDFRIEAPAFVHEQGSIGLRVRRTGDDVEVYASGGRSAPVVVAGARVGAHRTLPTPRIDIEALLAGGIETRAPQERLQAQRAYVDFGPRWDCIAQAWRTDSEVVARLHLDERFAADVHDHPFHPALLDLGIAVGLSTGRIAPGDLHVPVYAKHVAFYGKLTGDLYVTASTAQDESPVDPGWTIIDLQYLSASGECLVRIDGLAVRAVDPGVFVASETPAGRPHVVTPEIPIMRLGRLHGIRPVDGLAILRRLRASGQRGQVVVTSLALDSVERALAEAVAAPSSVGVARPDGAIPYRAPKSAGELAMIALWEATLGVSGIGLDDDFYALGGHSLLAVRLFAKVREQFGVRFGLATLFEAPNPSLLLRRVEAETQVPGEAVPGSQLLAGMTHFRSVVPIRPGGEQAALFCVHGAGGNVVNFTGLVRHLDQGRPIYGVQAAGTDGTMEPDASIDAMVDRYVSDLVSVYPAGRVHLIGYSGGGVIALEIATRLVAVGRDVAPVILLDTFHPSTDKRSRTQRAINVLHNIRAEGPAPVYRWTKNFVLYLLGRFVPNDDLDVGYGDPSDFGFVNLEEHFGRVIDLHPMRTYDLDADLITVRQIKATLPPRNGWTGWITGNLSHSKTPGTHRTMLDPENAPSLASVVQSLLKRCEDKTTPSSPQNRK